MRNYFRKLCCLPLLGIAFYSVSAQCTFNYLVNPGFETPAQSNNNGNNFPAGSTFNGWTITNIVPANPNPWNVVRVNGSGYGGGPDFAQEGLQYVDVTNAAGNVEQTFTIGCAANITFSGYFSSREAGGYINWTAQINILNSSNAVVATSATRNFTVGDADGTIDAVWFLLSGTASLPAGTYKYSAVVGNYGNFDNAFLCASPGCLLPVKLKSFDAKINDCTVNLNWVAEAEADFKQYVVEYSRNGFDFITAGFVSPLSANVPAKSYSFKHSPAAGTIFYRLRMVDIDGRFSYSKVVAVTSVCNKIIITAYPNPVTDKLTVNILNIPAQEIPSAALYDMTGRLIFKKQFASGSNTVDMQAMLPGVYKLVLTTENEVNIISVRR
jgi:Secretion system C-terminal sorting domain